MRSIFTSYVAQSYQFLIQATNVAYIAVSVVCYFAELPFNIKPTVEDIDSVSKGVSQKNLASVTQLSVFCIVLVISNLNSSLKVDDVPTYSINAD